MSNGYCVQSSGETGADERERLILEHLPQVRLIARRIHGRLPENVSLEDLVSAGIVGLIAAIDGYDPTHQVKLKTYAEHKIRGAILDALRGLDWARANGARRPSRSRLLFPRPSSGCIAHPPKTRSPPKWDWISTNTTSGSSRCKA